MDNPLSQLALSVTGEKALAYTQRTYVYNNCNDKNIVNLS